MMALVQLVWDGPQDTAFLTCPVGICPTAGPWTTLSNRSLPASRTHTLSHGALEQLQMAGDF